FGSGLRRRGLRRRLAIRRSVCLGLSLTFVSGARRLLRLRTRVLRLVLVTGDVQVELDPLLAALDRVEQRLDLLGGLVLVTQQLPWGHLAPSESDESSRQAADQLAPGGRVELAAVGVGKQVGLVEDPVAADVLDERVLVAVAVVAVLDVVIGA